MDIELAAAVAAVRDELLKAAEEGAGKDLVFEVGSVEMEFEIEVRADAKAGGGLKVWVLSAQAEAGASRTRTQRVSFKLTPKNADGTGLEVAGDHDRTGPGDLSGRVGR
ncbi:trypco2 family protein [Kitasatospora sp. NPDC092948]|uniref:trypco2 family protein n=1 Tax=Kitasatospora sp. NPDC092948 TaxID=3364088 RepID=UPI00382C40D1